MRSVASRSSSTPGCSARALNAAARSAGDAFGRLRRPPSSSMTPWSRVARPVRLRLPGPGGFGSRDGAAGIRRDVGQVRIEEFGIRRPPAPDIRVEDPGADLQEFARPVRSPAPRSAWRPGQTRSAEATPPLPSRSLRRPTGTGRAHRLTDCDCCHPGSPPLAFGWDQAENPPWRVACRRVPRSCPGTNPGVRLPSSW